MSVVVMDLRGRAGCWAGCDGCARCMPDYRPFDGVVVSADPEAHVVWTDVEKADLHLPAPEERIDCGGPDCGS